MYSDTAAALTLTLRAKCSLSLYCLSLPSDQPFFCRRPCCHFSVSPRILSGYVLGFSSPIPSICLFHAGRRRLRVFCRSRDSDMMGLLAEPEERFVGLGETDGKKWRREIHIDTIEGERRSSRKEGKVGICASGRSDEWSSVRDSELNEVGRSYGNRKKGAGFDAVDVAEEEVREVHKYVDDSWQERRNSRNEESTKRNGGFRRLGVKDVEEKVDQQADSGQQVNSRKSGSDRRSRKIEKGESSVSGARQNSGMDHRVGGHDQQRRSLGKQREVANFRYNDVQSDAFRLRDFEETSIRGRGERAYLEQSSASVPRDKGIHLDRGALEQDESRRSKSRLNEVSLFHGSDFERASPIDDKSVMGVDANSNLVQDSSQVSRNKRSQMEMELHWPIENRSKEREDELIMAGNSVQLRVGAIKQIDKEAVEHEEARRKTQMLSKVSEVHSGNMEAFSPFREKKKMDFGSNLIQSSIPATKNKGIQVEMHDACYDQIEMSRFNANNIVNATSSCSPPVSRVEPQEYGVLLASNQVSSVREQNDQANKQAYLLYDARVESERDTSEFDLTRSNNRRISNLQKTYNSRIENEKEFSLTEGSSLVLTQEEDIQRSSLIGENSQSASMEMTSTGSLHGEFGGKLQKETVALNDSGKTPNVSTEIEIGKPGRRDVQATLRIENQNETSSIETYSTVLTQERNEKHSSLLVGESSQHKAMQIASSGSLSDVSNSVKTYNEVDDHSGNDDVCHITKDAIESAKRLDKSSAFHVDEFVDEVQQEIMLLNESGKKPNVSTRFQIEEAGMRESQVTVGMQVGELTESRGYEDGRHIKEAGTLSSFESRMRGPSDEMWGVQVLSSQETSNVEQPEENSPISEAMGLTTLTPTMATTITRRSPKSLWSYVADIIRMSWILRGHSPSSTLKSVKRASSNESLSSEAWFSGPEPDEDGARDETQNTKKISLLKESGMVKESVKLPFEGSKEGDKFTMLEPNSSISSGFMTSGLSARTASSSIEVEHAHDSKSSQGTLFSVATIEQQLASKSDATLPSTTDIVESRLRDKVKVLKPSSSYPVGVMRVGFSSYITQATGAEQMEAAQVGEDINSSLKNFEQPSVSTIDLSFPRITDIEEVDRPESIPKLEFDPIREKLPEIDGTKEVGIKQRKFQRNKQVLSEQFDEWEEAFKRENEQKKFDEFFMREAILEAKKGADTWEVPVGAVLVQNGKIIARGCNMVEELRDSTAHAEMICIREASNLLRNWRLAETTLYVTLEPCPMCAGAILQARIDTVVWGAPNRLLGADGSWVRLFPGGDGGSGSMNPPSQMVGPVHPFHPKITIRRGVLETECGDVMQQFFKLRRKKDKKPESSPPPACLPISNRPTKFFSKLHNIFSLMFCL